MITDPGLVIAPCGAGAFRVVSASGDRDLDWRRVHALSRWLLEATNPAWSLSTIPTYDSMLIEFDAAEGDPSEVSALIETGLAQVRDQAPLPESRHFEVPVWYGHEDGPDIEFVADLEGISVAELIAAHTAKRHVIRCYGSPAASPMMDAPDLPLPVPRLANPRVHVPAGVVSLAGRQAVIAPAAAPGGWQVIGRTPLVLLRSDREPVVPYRPGDTIHFHEISEDEYRARLGEPMVPQP